MKKKMKLHSKDMKSKHSELQVEILKEKFLKNYFFATVNMSRMTFFSYFGDKTIENFFQVVRYEALSFKNSTCTVFYKITCISTHAY